MGFLRQIVVDFWAVLSEMSPYLLFGFLVAGLLSVWLSAVFVRRHLAGGGIWPVIKASGFGVPLPLCSCGVIPVSMSLRDRGAGKGAVISFLLSTPQTGVDSILVSYSLLGWVFAVYRPIVAFATGLIGGIAVEGVKKTDIAPPVNSEQSTGGSETGEDKQGHGEGPEHSGSEKQSHKLLRGLRYGFVNLPADIGKAMLVGLVIAAAISALVPEDFFAEKLGTGLPAMLVMMVLGIPVYVCSTASVPVAAALIAKGVTPGAALVFLMTGPATNAATIATIWKVLGARTAATYLLTVAGCALGGGLLLDFIGRWFAISVVSRPGWMLPGWVGNVSAVVLLAVLGYAIIRGMQPAEVTSEET